MKRPPRDHRDDNDAELTAHYRAKGASVVHLPIGGGAPDKLIGYLGVTELAEFKRPAGPKGGTNMRNVSKKQKDWSLVWNGSLPWIIRTTKHADDMLCAMAAKAARLARNPTLA